MKFVIFQPISLYLGNDTRSSYAYLQWLTNEVDLSNSTTFNDLERPLSHILRSHYYLMLNIEMHTLLQ